MKKTTCLLVSLATLSFTSVFGQSGSASRDNAASIESHDTMMTRVQADKNGKAQLTKFDLDFPGGTPRELVAAIQKAMNRPLNAVVPVDYASWKVPPLKMNGVNAAQLFQAMEQSSYSATIVSTGNGAYQQKETQYGFRQAEGQPTDDTVWYFYVHGPATMPKVSRFYYLAPYLQGGLTVDDITTAIQTGWRLRGDAPVPTLSFHKETKLLIAVGDYSGLDVIDQVLKALDAVKARPDGGKSAAESRNEAMTLAGPDLTLSPAWSFRDTIRAIARSRRPRVRSANSMSPH